MPSGWKNGGSVSTSHQLHDRRRLRWLAGVVIVVLAGLTGLQASIASGQRARAGASTLPKTIKAFEMTPDKSPFRRAGSVVSAKRLGIRVFVNGRDGFALANLTRGGGVTYPADTVNGGRTWRIAGPHFWVAAADAPNVMTQVGAVSPRTYFAYGGPAGGTTVAVSTDRGRHWWRAGLPGTVFAVSGASKLYAFIGVRGAYVSSDGGRVWTYERSPS